MIIKSNISWLCLRTNFKCKNYVHFSKKGCQKVYQGSQAGIWSFKRNDDFDKQDYAILGHAWLNEAYMGGVLN